MSEENISKFIYLSWDLIVIIFSHYVYYNMDDKLYNIGVYFVIFQLSLTMRFCEWVKANEWVSVREREGYRKRMKRKVR